MKAKLKINSIKFISVAIILFIFFLSRVNAHSEFVHLDCLSLDDGLSHNLVYCINQDSYGFMWFGTQYGLNRYDGYKFTTYFNDPSNSHSISSNLILTSFVDKDNNLWFGTSAGLNLYNYDLENFETFDIPDQSQKDNLKNEITAISQFQTGDLLLGTKSGELFKFNIEDKSFLTISLDINEISSITDICIDKKDNIWIGTSKGLIRTNLKEKNSNNNIQILKKPGILNGSNINVIFNDKNEKIWVGHENGIDCLDISSELLTECTINLAKFKHFKLPESESSEANQKIVSTIYRDASGILWIGTHGSGLYFFNNKTSQFQYYRPCKCLKDTGGLSSSWINIIFQNKNETIWVGTNEGLGKFTFNKQLFKKYEYNKDNENSLCQGEVKALLQDSDKIIWIGTWGNGICKLNLESGKFSHIKKNLNLENGLPSNFISEIYEDSNGKIWIGTDKPIGLYKYNPEYNSITHHPWNFLETEEFIPHPISSIIEERNGIFWIGTAGGGLIRFDSKQSHFSIFQHDQNNPSSLSNNHIYSIIKDSPNTLFITTANGLNRFIIDSGIFQRFLNQPKEDTKRGNNIYSILKADDNLYWLGTNNGLYKIIFEKKDYNIFPVITERDGLGGSAIYGILQNNQNLLWLLTNKGLSVFYPKTNQIRNFTTEDGCVKFTKKLSHGSNAQLKTKSGYMFFGGVNGLTYYEQNAMSGENIFIPPVLITDFQLNNKSITPSNSSILERSISSVEKISFSSGFGNFSIDFSILDYTSSSENQYAYMLKGWDQEWIYSGTQHSAHYAAIPSGNYEFIAKGANHEGLWNNEGTKLNIYIYPLFWETWWFRSFAMLLVISIFLIGHFYQLHKVKKEKKLQEDITRKVIDSQDFERKRIASELHDSLGQNLQVINSELTQIKALPQKNTVKNLNELSFLVKESIKEVREIAYDLHPHQLEQLGLQKAIESAIKKIAYISNINFNCSIGKIDKYFNEQDSIHFFRIVQEAVYNIYKHSEAKNAVIDIHKKNDQIFVDIDDDGKGFNVRLQFQNGKPIQEGLGLSNMYERAKLINCNLLIESIANKGTTVKISIPIRQ
jgi:signal transduction histidine kinase/ligand-binding sensor domain-containing protein